MSIINCGGNVQGGGGGATVTQITTYAELVTWLTNCKVGDMLSFDEIRGYDRDSSSILRGLAKGFVTVNHKENDVIYFTGYFMSYRSGNYRIGSSFYFQPNQTYAQLQISYFEVNTSSTYLVTAMVKDIDTISKVYGITI